MNTGDWNPEEWTSKFADDPDETLADLLEEYAPVGCGAPMRWSPQCRTWTPRTHCPKRPGSSPERVGPSGGSCCT